MAISSLVFVIPMIIVFSFMPAVDAHGNSVPQPPVAMFLLFPIMYFAMGYVMVRIGCWLYNLMFKHIGGIEFETDAP